MNWCQYLSFVLIFIYVKRTFSSACSCDLFANRCDLNCCCDSDCTEEEKKVFSSCTRLNNDHIEEVCVSDDLLFSVNGKYQIQGSGGGLLCLYKNNYNAKYFYADVSTVKDLNTFERLASKYRKSSYELKAEIEKNYENSFRVGDPLFILLSNNQQGFLPQPMSFITNKCDDSNPAQFLIPQESDCFRVVRNLKDECSNERSWNARSYFDGYDVAPYPSFIFGEKRVKIEKVNSTVSNMTTPKPTPKPIDKSQLIKPNLVMFTCRDSSGIENACNFTELPLKPFFNQTTQVCKNVVQQVLFQVNYENNVTVKITEVNVSIVLQDISKTFSQRNLFEFTTTKDTTMNSTNKSVPFWRSGNPGYVIGLPVVVAIVVGEGDGAFIYPSFSNDSVRFSSIITTSKGVCDTDSLGEEINFGADLRTGCFMYIDNVMNIVKQCETLQQNIFKILLGKLPTHVGSFGNPDKKKLSDWIAIINETPKSKPSLVNKECHNIYTSVLFEILFASTGFLKNPQRQIVGLRVKYGPAQNLISQCFGLFCSKDKERIELVQSVSFVDVSLTLQAKVKSKPEFESKAPHDFFYPFLT